MPPGTPYNSFVKPYPIRVDEFSVPRDGSLTVAALHLLTHTHSDHIIGLNSKSFGSIIICSEDAKEMLLRHETYQARFLREEDYVYEKQRTFEHLKFPMQASNEVFKRNEFDLIRGMPLHVPTKVEISNNKWVTITLIDANHCPGSVMFLIEGLKGAVLHTGDFRAEPVFIGSIIKNPFLRPYIVQDTTSQSETSESQDPVETLEAIYLDTANMLSSETIPSKKEAVSGLIDLMKAYPVHMRFFINVWTWGYEDILKAVSQAFESKIHVDRYKNDVYSSLSDRDLRALITQDYRSTRFHACERFARCDLVRNEDPGVVYINPVNISSDNWDLYLAKTKAMMERGALPMLLLVPLHRHSTLPELQNFVGLFRPRRLVPNFLEPSLHGLDWACMPNIFGPFMEEGGAARIQDEMSKSLSLAGIKNLEVDIVIRDSSLQNLEGGNATEELETMAGIWASGSGAVGGLLNAGGLIQRLMKFLPKGISALVERALRDSRQKALPVYLESEDDADSSSDDDSGIMAEFLFGGHISLPHGSNSLEDMNDNAALNDTDIMKHDGCGAKPHLPPRPSPSPGHTRRRVFESTKEILNAPSARDERGRGCCQMVTITNAHASRSGLMNMTSNMGCSSRKDGNALYYSSQASSIVIDAQTDSHSSSQPARDDVVELANSIAPSFERTSHEGAILSRRTSLPTASMQTSRHHMSQGELQDNRREKRRKKEARSELSRRLSLARPDLVNRKATSHRPRKLHKEASSSSSSAAPEHKPQTASASRRSYESPAGTTSSCEASINWPRSRSLEMQILEDLQMGRKPSLPAMKFVLNDLFPGK